LEGFVCAEELRTMGVASETSRRVAYRANIANPDNLATRTLSYCHIASENRNSADEVGLTQSRQEVGLQETR